MIGGGIVKDTSSHVDRGRGGKEANTAALAVALLRWAAAGVASEVVATRHLCRPLLLRWKCRSERDRVRQ